MESKRNSNPEIGFLSGVKIGTLVGIFSGAFVGFLEGLGTFFTVLNALLPAVPEFKEIFGLVAGLLYIILLYVIGGGLLMGLLGGILAAFYNWRGRPLSPRRLTIQLASLFAFAYSFVYLIDRLGLQELQSTKIITTLLSLGLILVLSLGLGLLVRFLLSKVMPEPGSEETDRPFESQLGWKRARNLAIGLTAVLVLIPLIFVGVDRLSGGRGNSVRAGSLAATPERPNIILLTIDALRADRLGAYGYEGANTPNLDRFAAEGIVFEQASSQAPWTFPSFASLFTSMYPSELGLSIGNNHISEMYTKRVDDARVTLAEALQASGYRTQAVVTNPWLKPEFGFAQGFEGFLSVDEPQIYHLDEVKDILLLKISSRIPVAGDLVASGYQVVTGNAGEPLVWDVRADRVTEEAITWLQTNQDSPFFLWIHYVDPHYPFDPPEGYRPTIEGVSPERMAYLSSYNEEDIYTGRARLRPVDIEALKALYDGEIAYNDLFVGQLLDEIDQLGLRQNTVVIVSSDHGDEFFEHGGYQHGHSLYDELIRVPLIMRGPEGLAQPARIDQFVQQIDLMPTILDMIGREKPPEAQGRSLLPLIQGAQTGDEPAPVMNFAEGLFLTEEKKALRAEGYKLIISPLSDQYELYDLIADPGEIVNLAPDEPARVQDLEEVILQWLLEARERAAELPLANSEAEFDPGAINRLREGGY